MTQVKPILTTLLFVVVYVLLDWASYLHAMYGLNITPWNPALALGMVWALKYGKWVAIPWFFALLLSDILVRNLPVAFPITLIISALLVMGYSAIVVAMRRFINDQGMLGNQRNLLLWLGIVLCGTFLTSSLYIALLLFFNLIPVDDWWLALLRFWVGDCVGVIVTMPFFWLLLGGAREIAALLFRWETVAYALLALAMLWMVFGLGGSHEFQYFYLLFLPIVWAAARQGITGAAFAAFMLQAGIMAAAHWQNLVVVTVFELQMLGAVLAFVGLFIGVIVDEKQRINNELQQSLRLAAAGEMAAALAHELNQPLTALSSFGMACEELLMQGGREQELHHSIQRMVQESFRAANVVRRLRDFFRAGTTHLEHISLADLLNQAATVLQNKMHGVQLQLDTIPDCNLLVDKLQLEVVLRNLLANAYDAVLAQQHARIHVYSQLDKSYVHIFVADNGPGVAHHARLFEAFQSSKAHGLGLGLTISRAIAEAHGGKLTAEPAPHGLFKLTLPREQENSHDDK